MKAKFSTIKQIGLYFGVALVGLCFDFGVLVFLTELIEIHYLIAAIFGFIAGLTITFYLSNLFVFSNPKNNSHTKQFVLFGLVGIAGLILLSLGMWLLTDLLSVNYIFSKLLTTAIVFIWNFLARRALYEG